MSRYRNRSGEQNPLEDPSAQSLVSKQVKIKRRDSRSNFGRTSPGKSSLDNLGAPKPQNHRSPWTNAQLRTLYQVPSRFLSSDDLCMRARMLALQTLSRALSRTLMFRPASFLWQRDWCGRRNNLGGWWDFSSHRTALQGMPAWMKW